MIDQFRYQMLLDINDDLGVTRQAVNNWKRLGRVPLVHALLADNLTNGKLNAYKLTNGYHYTSSEVNLMMSAVDSIISGEACKSTAHILNYLQIAQPPLYDKATELISIDEIGKAYLENRMMHTGESGEAQHDS